MLTFKHLHCSHKLAITFFLKIEKPWVDNKVEIYKICCLHCKTTDKFN